MDVAVEVLRDYPRGGEIHPVGARISIPGHAIDEAVGARPPFVRVIDAAVEPEPESDEPTLADLEEEE